MFKAGRHIAEPDVRAEFSARDASFADRGAKALGVALAWWTLLLLLPSPATAQGTRFVAYDNQIGLSQSQVTAIYQDHRGYLWIGTVAGGLNRFDGLRFEVYRHSRGLDSSWIRTLVERRGVLWVGTRDGLFRQVGETFERVPVASEPNRDIYHLALTPDDGLLISSPDGLFSLEGDEVKEDIRVRLLPKMGIMETTFSSDGTLWLIGRLQSGAIRGMTFEPLELPAQVMPECLLATQDTIYIGTRQGLFRVVGQGLEPVSPEQAILRQRVTSLFEAKDGTLWVGLSRGLASVKDGRLRFMDASRGFPGVRVRAISQDHEGNLYAGTDGEGLLQLPLQPFEKFEVPGLPTYSAIATALDARGRRYIATFGQGLTVLSNQEAFTVPASSGLTSADITAFLLEGNTLYLGTNADGLFVGDASAPVLTFTPVLEVGTASITAIASHQGRIYLATELGLRWLADGVWHHQSPENGFPSRCLKTLEPSSAGGLWIGTCDSGALLWDPKSETVQHRVSVEQGLPSRAVQSIAEGADGALFLGTDLGLAEVEGTRVTVTTSEQGLPDDCVNDLVLLPEDALWVGTNRGVALRENGGWRTFTDRHGLPSAETNANALFLDDAQRLWVGTNLGYAILISRPPPSNPHRPFVYLESFTVNDRPLSLEGPLELKPEENRIRVRYVGLSFVDPSRVKYRYRLVGRDDATPFTLTSHREVEFSSLAPGRYRFELLASNNDGLWTSSPVTLSFVIRPPYTQTLWYKALQALGVFIAGLLVFALRALNLRKQKRLLEEQVQARTAELKEEKEKTEQLLLNVLPAPIAAEVREKGVSAPRLFTQATVLIVALEDFGRGDNLSPDVLLAQRDTLFTRFDELCRSHRLEKLKTVGDTYMAVGGLPLENNSHPLDAVELALDIQTYLEDRAQEGAAGVPQVRIGLHTGPVVAGVVGKFKFAYDIWGDAVSVAGRIQAVCEPGLICISRATYERVRERYLCERLEKSVVSGAVTWEVFRLRGHRVRG